MRTLLISGSYGELDVHRETGAVLAYRSQGEDPEYANIARIDVAEYQQWLATHRAPSAWSGVEIVDICAVGFWTTDGVYEAPIEDFRDPRPTVTPLPLPF